MSNIPSDIVLLIPTGSKLNPSLQHFLTYIPWDDKYLERVPVDFRDFFQFVLPNLHVRTTDVHEAICLGFLDEFIRECGFENVNRRVLGIAFILHDNGWSLLSEEEIATSVGVDGLRLNDVVMKPKEKHAVLGAKRAKQILESYQFQPPLTQSEKELILKCVLYHDKPWEVAGQNMPAEVQLLVDLDHIWSFTHENFWQDTVRKGIEPRVYADNLERDLEGYFVTDFGKRKAQAMLADRRHEFGKM